MESAASALASAPAMAAATTAKLYSKKLIKQGATKGINAGKFAAKPLTNPVTSRLDRIKEKTAPKIKMMKNKYENLNTYKKGGHFENNKKDEGTKS